MTYLEQMNPKHMLNAMGIGPRTDTVYLTDTILPALAIFSAGLVVGATVALLVAPKPGRELRDDISRKANELTGTVRNRLPSALQGENGGVRERTPDV